MSMGSNGHRSHSTLPVFDRAKALLYADGDEALLKELLTDFISRSQTQIKSLKGVIGNSNCHALERKAHEIRGILGILGALRAWETARQAEEYARRDRLADAIGTSETLIVEINQFVDAIRHSERPAA